MSIILGIDCSSTTIGYSVLEIDKESIKLIEINYIKPLKNGHFIENLADTRNKIKQLIERIKPDYIAIEEIVKFMSGASSAQTIITLASFNRMVCLLSYDFLGKPPELFNVLAIRHGIKNDKILPKKEDIPELVAKHLGIIFPYQKGKKGKIIEENYDMADGAAVALYYCFILSGKITRKISRIKPKKKKKVVKLDELNQKES